jgi:Ca2+-binding EF-hand superfamily protein
MQRVLDAFGRAEEEAERMQTRGQLRRAGSPASRRQGGRSHRRKLPRPNAGRTRAEILQLLQVDKRLSASDRYEMERQVRNNEVHSWLTKHSVRVVPRTELSRKRKALLQGCFQLLDVDGNGSIEFEELALAMKALGFRAEDTKEAFDRGDASQDGNLDFEEFVQMFTVAWAHRESRVAFNDSFGRDMQDVVEAAGGQRAVREQDADQQHEQEVEEASTESGQGDGVADPRRGGEAASSALSHDPRPHPGSAAASRPGGVANSRQGHETPPPPTQQQQQQQQQPEVDMDAQEKRVTTAFPFALVANSHRITKLIDACNPTVRELSLPKIEVYVTQEERKAMARRASERRASTRLPALGGAPRRMSVQHPAHLIGSIADHAAHHPSEEKSALAFTERAHADEAAVEVPRATQEERRASTRRASSERRASTRLPALGVR